MIELRDSNRVCSRCRQEKPRDEFYKNLLQCRDCKRAIKASYREANKESIAARKLIYRAANKEKIKNYQAKYCADNAQVIAQKKAAYAAANPEKIAAMGADYRSRNRDKISKRKARWAEAIPDCLVAYRLTMYSRVLRPSDVPQELIKSRRAIIKLKRLIKERLNEKR